MTEYGHDDHMDRDRLAEYVIAARRTHYKDVQAAVRASGLNRGTWEKVEAGKSVREATLIQVAEALGWDRNDPFRIAAGMEPLAEPEPPATTGRFAALRAHVEGTDGLPDYARRAILGILDALDAEGNEHPGSNTKGA